MYFISDLHFYHQNVIKYLNRPFSSVEEMHEKMIQSWNKKVSNRDIVYVLGDLFIDTRINQIDNILNELNGHLFIIKGNHDKWLSKINRLVNTHKIIDYKDYHEISVVIDNIPTKIIMSHYPMLSWNKSHFGSIMLHGHCHGSIDHLNLDQRRLDVGVDANKSMKKDSFAPWHLDEIINIMRNKSFDTQVKLKLNGLIV